MNFKQPENKLTEREPLTPEARLLWVNSRDKNCTQCELHKWAKTVCMFGNGPVPATGMIVGEGPGTMEDNLGRPFVGASGEYLNGVLYDLELDRSDFYISNATKCKPPRREGKDTYLREAVKACAHYLEAEIAAVKPKVILAVGNYAFYHFAHKTGITKSRGKEFFSEAYQCLVVPTVHPAFIMMNPEYHDPFMADVVKFKNILLDKKPPAVEIVEIHSEEDWALAKEDLMQNPNSILTFDLETRGLIDYKPEFTKTWCAGITRDGRKSYLLPLEHPESPFLENPDPDWEANWKLNWPDINYRIAPQYHHIVREFCEIVFSSKLNNHNLKFDIRHLVRLAQRYGCSDLVPYVLE